MWGLAAMVYSVCVRGGAQNQRCLGECQLLVQIYFLFSVEGLSSSQRFILQRFLFSIILYQRFIFPQLRYSFMVSEFQFIQYQPGFILFYFSRSTSSRAALGEEVLQYWYQSSVLRSLQYTHRMLGRVRTCVCQLDKLAQLIVF